MDEIEVFWDEVYELIKARTYITTYMAMPEESRTKYCSKLVIDVCKEFSPRKNYDITMEEIHEFTAAVLSQWEAEQTV